MSKSESKRTERAQARMETMNVYHDHLDVCAQCRNHPFDLCPIGVAKIHEAISMGGQRYP